MYHYYINVLPGYLGESRTRRRQGHCLGWTNLCS